MNTNKVYAQMIANEYSKKDESKVIALKKLDKKAKMPSQIFVYTNGIISTFIFGLGMCLSMKVIGSSVIFGIIIGIIGLVGITLNFPIYKKISLMKSLKGYTILKKSDIVSMLLSGD